MIDIIKVHELRKKAFLKVVQEHWVGCEISLYEQGTLFAALMNELSKCCDIIEIKREKSND